MSNEIKTLIKKIQAEVGGTQGDIGKKLGYNSTSHFNTLINKADQSIKDALLLHYPFLTGQNIRKSETNNLAPGKRIITMDDYYARIEGEVEFLRELVKSGVSTLLTNSERLIDGQDEILSAFGRGRDGLLEKDAETDKAYEESKKIAANLKAQQKGKGTGKIRK